MRLNTNQGQAHFKKMEERRKKRIEIRFAKPKTKEDAKTKK